MKIYIYEYSADDVELDYSTILAENQEDARKKAWDDLASMYGVKVEGLKDMNAGVDVVRELEFQGYKITVDKI